MLHWRNLALAGALALGLFTMAPSSALAITVQPVVIDLSPVGRDMSQVITVENTFATPLTVELKVEELSFDENGAHPTGKDPGDLLIFPPQAIIQPGDTQAFRVQWVGDPDLKASKHFYVTVAQLPVQMPAGQSAIQILYNFQVLVSVKPTGGKPDLKIVSAEVGKDSKGNAVPVLMIENDSNTHGYLSQGTLRIIEKDSSGKQIFEKTLPGPEIQQTIGFGLIASGQKRRVTVPVVLPQDGGQIEARFTPDSRR